MVSHGRSWSRFEPLSQMAAVRVRACRNATVKEARRWANGGRRRRGGEASRGCSRATLPQWRRRKGANGKRCCVLNGRVQWRSVGPASRGLARIVASWSCLGSWAISRDGRLDAVAGRIVNLAPLVRLPNHRLRAGLLGGRGALLPHGPGFSLFGGRRGSLSILFLLPHSPLSSLSLAVPSPLLRIPTVLVGGEPRRRLLFWTGGRAGIRVADTGRRRRARHESSLRAGFAGVGFGRAHGCFGCGILAGAGLAIERAARVVIGILDMSYTQQTS